VAAIQLPGRAPRFGELLISRMEPLVDELCHAIQASADRPFAFYGHSMGARVAFELARRLRADLLRLPEVLFVSGAPAPHVAIPTLAHKLPDREFAVLLRELGGTPPEVFDYPALYRVLLPALRADFAVVETCPYRPERPLNCPISAFAGSRDAEVSRPAVAAWEQHTEAIFRLRVLPGDHFFPWSHRAALLKAVSDDLAAVAA